MTERITELEIKLSLMEDTVEELNRVVFRQQQQLDLFQAQLRHLYRQMQAQSEGADPAAAPTARDEIPPHY